MSRSIENTFEIFRQKYKVDRTTGCWIWKSQPERGHPRFTVNGKAMTIGRAAYELNHGPIPDGMVVCHNCDNSYCVNPDHLYLSTKQDSIARARENSGPVRRVKKPQTLKTKRRSKSETVMVSFRFRPETIKVIDDYGAATGAASRTEAVESLIKLMKYYTNKV